MIKHPVIAFIGGGNMARSLLVGLLGSDYDPDRLWVTGRTPEKLEYLSDTLQVHATVDNKGAANLAEILVLAVKPQQVRVVCEELKSIIVKQKPLIISVANGVTEAAIRNWLADDIAVVRAMPNTAASVKASATGLYANKKVSVHQRDIAESILRSVGLALWVDDEAQIDAITALSGSGPAYIFLVMEAMQAAGEALGLSAKVARLLTLETVQGAARMALESQQDVVQLREHVTSPGGSTEQAVRVFQENHIEKIFKDALSAAYEQAKTLTKTLQ